MVALCRKRGLTVQAFGHAAMMRALNEATLGKKTDGEVARDDEDRRTERELPRGLGIRDRLQRDADDRRDERRARAERGDDEPTPPTHSPTQTPNLLRTSVSDEVMTLAHMIVEAPAASRRERMKEAHRVLSRSVIARGGNQDMALQLADDLDAAIRRLEGAPQTALERVRARGAAR